MTAALAASVAVFSAGCEKLGPDPNPPFNPDAPAQTIIGTRIIWSENGVRGAVIDAHELIRRSDDDNVTLKDSVRVKLYDDDGNETAIVTGDEGVIDENARTASVDDGIKVRFLGNKEYKASVLTARQARAIDKTKLVIASGDVVIKSESGARLTTDQLVWDGRNRRFRAPGLVRIESGDDVEEGYGLDANADLTQWTMDRVRGKTTRERAKVDSSLRRSTGE